MVIAILHYLTRQNRSTWAHQSAILFPFRVFIAIWARLMVFLCPSLVFLFGFSQFGHVWGLFCARLEFLSQFGHKNAGVCSRLRIPAKFLQFEKCTPFCKWLIINNAYLSNAPSLQDSDRESASTHARSTSKPLSCTFKNAGTCLHISMIISFRVLSGWGCWRLWIS